ncbi:uncharacterized protein LOC113684666 [Pocillopora damicornis]|uniref:uncharacterized protein LOC113684666 n=1 Tax=Pocillopora damicornis TaxID=46731 RepID=UPI000F55865C|nr:uncharacterized protein LOC113684666 [Pocillopora damicornis]
MEQKDREINSSEEEEEAKSGTTDIQPVNDQSNLRTCQNGSGTLPENASHLYSEKGRPVREETGPSGRHSPIGYEISFVATKASSDYKFELHFTLKSTSSFAFVAK